MEHRDDFDDYFEDYGDDLLEDVVDSADYLDDLMDDFPSNEEYEWPAEDPNMDAEADLSEILTFSQLRDWDL